MQAVHAGPTSDHDGTADTAPLIRLPAMACGQVNHLVLSLPYFALYAAACAVLVAMVVSQLVACAVGLP